MNDFYDKFKEKKDLMNMRKPFPRIWMNGLPLMKSPFTMKCFPRISTWMSILYDLRNTISISYSRLA